MTVSTCSLPALPPEIGPEEVETGPSAVAAVTIAVAGTAQSADQAPPPATGTPRQAVRVKKAVKKKSKL
jgi:hypothetical protein